MNIYLRLVIFLLAVILPAQSVFADSKKSDLKGVDAVIILDLSGSMGHARQERFERLFEWTKKFLSPGDSAGIITIGSRSKVVQQLVPLAEFKPRLDTYDFLFRAKFTNIAAGLEDAYYILKDSSSLKRQKVIVLFSDGKIDLKEGAEAKLAQERYLKNMLIPALVSQKIKVLSFVPAGLASDIEFLSDLSLKTGGEYFEGFVAEPEVVRHNCFVKDEITEKKIADNKIEKPASFKLAKSEHQLKPLEETAKIKNNEVLPENVDVKKSAANEGDSLGLMFGVILIGFALVFGGMLFLFMRIGRSGTKRSSSVGDERLSRMINEIQSLREGLEVGDDSVEDQVEYHASVYPDESLKKNSVHPASISPGLVTSFLDYSDDESSVDNDETENDKVDDFLQSDNKIDNPELSISLMETLIGLPSSSENIDTEKN
ncbi:MAG: VWA domain-containing protein [Deltaproteobacteria bacterium]|nr:VWA domain-containing protein [Deltaproteobacteria bacterium]